MLTWQLKRPSHGAVLQECRYLLRKHRFEELARSDPAKALHYLQTEVHAAVDHTSEEKQREVGVNIYKHACYVRF
jgi:muskelin